MKFAGRDFRCELLISGLWVTVNGERSSSAKINNEQVDTTDKDGVPWRGLSPCGIRTADITVSGMMTNGAVVAALQTAVFNGTLVTARIFNGNGESIGEGPYYVNSFERGGEYNNAETFAASLTSAASTISEPAVPMILTIDTRKSAGAAGHTIAKHFKLPLTSGGSYDFTVDWGDGTSSEITDWDDLATEHTYPNDQVYTVSILGRCTVWYFNNGGDRLKVITVTKCGNGVTNTLNFYGCANLESVSGSLTDYPRVTNFTNIFRGCSGLTSFPLIDTSRVTLLDGSWRDCSGLTSFPAIDTSSVTNFGSAWYGCSKIGQASVPIGTFPLIDTSKATTISYAWYGCIGLTSFPAINTSAALSFNGTWSACSNLTSFPMLLFTATVTDFTSAWRGCRGLEGYAFPALDMRTMTNGNECFGVTHPTNGYAMAAASYDALLNKMYTGPAANPNTSVAFGGGNSKYTAAAVTAHDYLAITRTWSITDGGLLV